MLVNPAAGNEPVVLGAQIGMAVNEKLMAAGHEPFDVIIPVVSERQESVIKDELSDTVPYGRVFFDRAAGAMIKSVIGHQGNFEQHLKDIIANKPDADWLLNSRYLTGRPIEVHDLNNQTTIISPEVLGTLDIGGRTSIASRFRHFAFPVLFSELVEAASELALASDSSDFRRAAWRMAATESGYTRTFLPWVNTLSGESLPENAQLTPEQVVEHLDNQPQSTRTEFTPPLKGELSAEESEFVGKEGIYVMMSGTGSATEQTLEAAGVIAENGQMAVYTNPFMDQVEGGVKLTPKGMGDPRINAVVGRAGWGTGWRTMRLRKPWLVLPFQEGDDPEIYFNNRTIQRTGIGEVVTELTEDTIRLANELYVLRIARIGELTVNRFGTENGVDYVADRIVADYSRNLG